MYPICTACCDIPLEPPMVIVAATTIPTMLMSMMFSVLNHMIPIKPPQIITKLNPGIWVSKGCLTEDMTWVKLPDSKPQRLPEYDSKQSEPGPDAKAGGTRGVSARTRIIRCLFNISIPLVSSLKI